MALKDVKHYYLDMESEYLEAKKLKEELVRDYKQGKASDEQVTEFQKYFNDLEINYKRLSYVMYLFNLPRRRTKVYKYDLKNKELVNYYDQGQATQHYIELENANVLAKLNDILKQINPEKEEVNK